MAVKWKVALVTATELKVTQNGKYKKMYASRKFVHLLLTDVYVHYNDTPSDGPKVMRILHSCELIMARPKGERQRVLDSRQSLFTFFTEMGRERNVSARLYGRAYEEMLCAITEIRIDRSTRGQRSRITQLTLESGGVRFFHMSVL